jgi:hypothetical protein
MPVLCCCADLNIFGIRLHCADLPGHMGWMALAIISWDESAQFRYFASNFSDLMSHQ